MYVPRWLQIPPTFDLKGFIQTWKCEKAECTSCECHQLKISYLPLSHCNKNCQMYWIKYFILYIYDFSSIADIIVFFRSQNNPNSDPKIGLQAFPYNVGLNCPKTGNLVHPEKNLYHLSCPTIMVIKKIIVTRDQGFRWLEAVILVRRILI